MHGKKELCGWFYVWKFIRIRAHCFRNIRFIYRYIVTNRGMHAMYEKYRTAAFGRCPRVFCQGQPVLPVGLSDLPRNYTVNVFCPRCHGLFFPKSTRQANIDGAYFGTTFPHLYLMTHPVSTSDGVKLMPCVVSCLRRLKVSTNPLSNSCILVSSLL
jgi:hypothetical protein